MTTQQDLVRQFLVHRDMVLAYLLAMTRDSAVAEEIFQETALAVLEEARHGVVVTNVAGWTREIARRRALEHFRRRERDRRMTPLDEVWLEGVEQAFAENIWTAEDLQMRQTLLRECLAKLGDRARQVVELHYRGEKSLSQIAAVLAWQVESVTVALSRARRALSECVQSKLRLHEVEPQ